MQSRMTVSFVDRVRRATLRTLNGSTIINRDLYGMSFVSEIVKRCINLATSIVIIDRYANNEIADCISIFLFHSIIHVINFQFPINIVTKVLYCQSKREISKCLPSGGIYTFGLYSRV